MTVNFIPLNANRHRYLKLKQHEGYRYANSFGQSDLLLAEFGRASVHYPILFVGHISGTVRAVALLSRDGASNNFVNSEGHWLSSYVPMVLRLHPFAIARVPQKDTPVVCIDMNSQLLSHDSGVPLFDMNGDPTPALSHAMDQLNDADAMFRATENFCRMLQTLRLLVPFNLPNVNGNLATGLEDCYRVDERALDSLSDAALCVLRKEGWLAPLYAHRISLSQFDVMPDPEFTHQLSQPVFHQSRGVYA